MYGGFPQDVLPATRAVLICVCMAAMFMQAYLAAAPAAVQTGPVYVTSYRDSS